MRKPAAPWATVSNEWIERLAQSGRAIDSMERARREAFLLSHLVLAAGVLIAAPLWIVVNGAPTLGESAIFALAQLPLLSVVALLRLDNLKTAQSIAAFGWLALAAACLFTGAHAAAVVIGLQADMWDPSALAAGGDGLDRYTGFVRELANQAVRFRRPVLLINGDSHLYGSDHPLADPSSTTGKIHNAAAAANLTRVTVQGSTNAPGEWLRLTIDARTPSVFSWKNVAYCVDPLTSCK